MERAELPAAAAYRRVCTAGWVTAAGLALLAVLSWTGVVYRPAGIARYLVLPSLALPALFYLRAIDAASRVPTRTILKFAILFAAIGLVTLPFHSTDVFFYMAKGWQQAHYASNPYSEGLRTLSHDGVDPMIFTGWNALNKNSWLDLPLPYGFLFAAFVRILASLGGGNWWLTLALFTTLNGMTHAATAWLIWRLSHILKTGDPKRALFLYAWNPFMLAHFLGDLHNDIFVGFFIVLAVYSLAAKRPEWTLTALTAGGLIKYVAFALTPFAAIAILRLFGRRKLVVSAAWAAAMAALVSAPYLMDAPLFKISLIVAQVTESSGSFHTFVMGILGVLGATTLRYPNFIPMLSLALQTVLWMAFAVFIAQQAWESRWRRLTLDRIVCQWSTAMAFLLFFSSSQLYAWYIGMLLPLAVLGYRSWVARAIILASTAHLFSFTGLRSKKDWVFPVLHAPSLRLHVYCGRAQENAAIGGVVDPGILRRSHGQNLSPVASSRYSAAVSLVSPAKKLTAVASRIVDNPRWFNACRILLLLAVIGAIASFSAAIIGKKSDFAVFLNAAHLVLEGRDIYATPDADGQFYIYLPLLSVLFAPFAWMPSAVVIVLWTASNVILLAWSIQAFYQAMTGISVANQDIRLRWALYFFTLALTFDSLLGNFRGGQTNILVLALAVLGLECRGKTQGFAGGLVLGISAVIKVLSIPLIAWLFVQKKLRGIFGSVAGIATGLLFPALFFGFEKNWRYLSFWIHKIALYEDLRRHRVPLEYNLSFQAVLYRLFSPTVAFQYKGSDYFVTLFVLPDAWIRWAGMLLIPATLALLLLYRNKYSRGDALISHWGGVALSFTLAPLFTSVAEKHHFVFLVPAYIYVIHIWMNLKLRDKTFRSLIAASFIFGSLSAKFFVGAFTNKVLYSFGLPSIGAVLLAAAIFRAARCMKAALRKKGTDPNCATRMLH